MAALYDMVRFDEENMHKRPGFLEWISTIQDGDGRGSIGTDIKSFSGLYSVWDSMSFLYGGLLHGKPP